MKPRKPFFSICSVCAIVVGLYHINKFFFPDVSSAARHLLFVGINAIVAYGLWKRPSWFLYVFGILVLQQLYSHGGQAFLQWRTLHRVDWISIAIILIMPVIFIALLKDKNNASQTS